MKNGEKPAVTDLFDYTYADLPEELKRQRETMRTDSIGQDPKQLGLRVPVEQVPNNVVAAARGWS